MTNDPMVLETSFLFLEKLIYYVDSAVFYKFQHWSKNKRCRCKKLFGEE